VAEDVCQVTTTVDSVDAAGALAHSAVDARLAACAQVLGPVASTYRWQGAVEQSTEWMVVFKSTVERYPALEEHLRSTHPYEVPEIVRTPVGGSAAYLGWVRTSTGAAS
jgi:periplasmic divalent cation tolerance protein